MPEKKSAALRKRVSPFTMLKLELAEPGNSQIVIELKLAFDMNAGARIEEQTGLLLTNIDTWKHLRKPSVLRAMLWAASIAHQPEYVAEGGLEVIGSYIDENNADQIADALWCAYMNYLPPARAKFLDEQYQNAKKGAETERPLDETKPAKAETKEQPGSSSGPSPDTTSVSASTSSAG
jgi:hypothetical protein